jgi:hypothetical protein
MVPMRPLAITLIAFLLAPAAHADDAAVFAQYERVLAKAGAVRPQLQGLDAAQRERLYTLVLDHPVARLDRLPHYDPDGLIGFCFGRAMTAHLTARTMGLAESSIRKLFIVGDLRQYGADKTEWRFHVTTLVRGTDRAWHAIDPILGRAMPATEWIRTVQRTWDHRKQARLYVTRASAVLPDVRETPAPEAETGARLIELKFDPRGRAGFTPRPDLSPATWEMDVAATEALFLDAAERDRFNLVDITINGMTIGYRDYFADLLGRIGTAPRARATALAHRVILRNLGSPDFSRLIRKR